MTSTRWLIVVAALAILFVVGRTIWGGSSPTVDTGEDQPAQGGSAKSSKRSGFGSDRRGTDRGKKPAMDATAGIGIDELPSHLRALVLHVERLADTLTEEYTTAELLGARSELKPRLAKLTVEDISLLIRFYKEYNVDWEVRSEDLIRGPLFVLLGQKGPDQARTRIWAEVDRRMADRPGVDLNNPYGAGPEIWNWASIYEGWAALDPQAALADWDRMRGDLEQVEGLDGVGHVDGVVRTSLMRGWAADDPAAARDHLLDNVSSDTTDLIDGFFEGLQPDAPWQDLVSTFHEELGEDFEDYLPEALGHWALADHEAMFAWMEDQELNPDGLHEDIFEEWFGRDTTSTAVDWLRDNAAGLTPHTRSEAVEAALAFQRHRLEEVLPIVTTLDRSERTWNLLRNLADISLSYDEDVPIARIVEMEMPTLELAQIRPLLDHFEAPDELRQQIEDAYARRAARGE